MLFNAVDISSAKDIIDAPATRMLGFMTVVFGAEMFAGRQVCWRQGTFGQSPAAWLEFSPLIYFLGSLKGQNDNGGQTPSHYEILRLVFHMVKLQTNKI